MKLRALLVALLLVASPLFAADPLRDLQSAAIANGKSPAAHWGIDPDKYTQWGTHSNRLIPVYTFGTRNAPQGARLDDYQGANSPYRREAELKRLYGRLPTHTLNPAATYLDQTNLYDLQLAALESGKKKYIFLVIFDGMDWQTTRAAAIYNKHAVTYSEGRGSGTHFQDDTAGGNTEFGFMVTAPHNEGTNVDVNAQRVLNPGGKLFGGYDAARGGPTPWQPGNDLKYLIGQSDEPTAKHPYTDSSSSASSMTAGIKTYNNAVNVDAQGNPVRTIAHQAQEAGWSVGAISSVPISHATPACTYSHNVDRDDYQDLTRDMLGLPSIAHPQQPLPGMQVVIGGGYGVKHVKSAGQGENFVPGNAYLTDEDLKASDARNGGRYVVAQRTAGKNGRELLARAVEEAGADKQRLLGFFGVGAYNGHLPFATADGDFQPVPGRNRIAEKYSPADLEENPTLADMTQAGMAVLSRNPKGFWLMVEPGDVDWANHDDNLDNSIGAVNSGDAAVKAITDWVERHSNWDESLLIVTADHGHFLVIDRPELLTGK